MTRWLRLSEVRLGLRLIAKQPVLSITVVLALATGICLATMGFTLRDAIMNGKLPFANGDRFVRLAAHSDDDNVDLDLESYHAIRDTSKTFTHLGGAGGNELGLEDDLGNVEPIRVGLLTPRSFAFLPAVPLHGRTLVAADGEAGADPVAVLRESLWHRRFGDDPAVIGKQIQLAGVKRTIVGVLPDTFEFPAGGEIWLPLDEATLGGRGGQIGSTVQVFGILRPGLDIAGATAELAAYSRPAVEGRPGSAMSVLAINYTGDSGTVEILMSGLVAVLVLVLLVVASNIATLVFARTWSRSTELAVRTAVGASRSRIVGQLFIEVLILGTLASAIGLGLEWVSMRYLVSTMQEIPFWVSFDPSLRTVAFVIALAFVVSMVSGLVPALKVTRRDLTQNLHAQGRGSAAGGFGRLGGVLLVAQIAVSVAFLNGALVLARAFTSYIDDIPALPRGEVLTAHLNGELTRDVRARLLAEIRRLPGVRSAGVASHLPRQDPMAMPVETERDGEMIQFGVPQALVGDGFLESIGARAVAGRLLTANDFVVGAAPVAVVNQPFVEQFLHGRSPIGRRIRTIDSEISKESPWREIVGVVPDLGMSAGDRTRAAGMYVPLSEKTTFLEVAVRTTSRPGLVSGPLRKIVTDVDSSLLVRDIIPLEEVGSGERAFLSGLAASMTALGAMALALSVVSIYALLSFMVTRRTREIGIRVALGAARAQIVRGIAGNAVVLLIAGAVLGSFLGSLLIGLRAVILIRMPEMGVATPAAVIALLGVSSLIAAWIPTRRALSIRPSEALNTD